MKLSAKLSIPSVNLDRYRDAVAQALTDAVTSAAFAWLQAMIGAIPSWSGASRGTLLKLAGALHTTVPISLAASAPADRTALGDANSTGGLNLDDARTGRVSFQYSTTLAHLIWNEYNNANITPDATKWRHVKLVRPGPYNFQTLGAAAAKATLQHTRLPSPRQFITVKPVQV